MRCRAFSCLVRCLSAWSRPEDGTGYRVPSLWKHRLSGTRCPAPFGLRHRVRGRDGIGWEGNEFLVVGIRKLEPPCPPVGLGLFDPPLRRSDKIPFDEPRTDRLAANREQCCWGRRFDDGIVTLSKNQK